MTYCLRRIGIAVIGGVVIVLGIAMLILPGPGVLTIVAGLGVLATEFEFARRSLHWCKSRTGRFARYLKTVELPPAQRS